jgi:hypothetical protein
MAIKLKSETKIRSFDPFVQGPRKTTHPNEHAEGPYWWIHSDQLTLAVDKPEDGGSPQTATVVAIDETIRLNTRPLVNLESE